MAIKKDTLDGLLAGRDPQAVFAKDGAIRRAKESFGGARFERGAHNAARGYADLFGLASSRAERNRRSSFGAIRAPYIRCPNRGPLAGQSFRAIQHRLGSRTQSKVSSGRQSLFRARHGMSHFARTPVLPQGDRRRRAIRRGRAKRRCSRAYAEARLGLLAVWIFMRSGAHAGPDRLDERLHPKMAIKQRDRRHHKAARKSERGTKQDSPAASPVACCSKRGRRRAANSRRCGGPQRAILGARTSQFFVPSGSKRCGDKTNDLQILRGFRTT
jgi:hypothetical protein